MIRNPFIWNRSVLTSLCVGAVSFVAVCAWTSAAHAEQDLGFFGYGARLGGSVDPDQLTVGGYVKLGKMTQMLAFRPSVDLGFGDNLFTVAGNVDAQVDFVDMDGSYKPFVGGGLGLF